MTEYLRSEIERITGRKWKPQREVEKPDPAKIKSWYELIDTLNAEPDETSPYYVSLLPTKAINTGVLAKLYMELGCVLEPNCWTLLTFLDLHGTFYYIGVNREKEVVPFSFAALNLGNVIGEPEEVHKLVVAALGAYYPSDDIFFENKAASAALHPRYNAPAALIVPIIIQVKKAGPEEKVLFRLDMKTGSMVPTEETFRRSHYIAIITSAATASKMRLAASVFRQSVGHQMQHRFYYEEIEEISDFKSLSALLKTIMENM